MSVSRKVLIYSRHPWSNPQIISYLGPEKRTCKSPFLLSRSHPRTLIFGSTRELSINLLPFSIPCSSTKRRFPTMQQNKWINPLNKYTTTRCSYKPADSFPTVQPIVTLRYRLKVKSSKLRTTCILKVTDPRECHLQLEEKRIEKENAKGRRVWRKTCLINFTNTFGL